MSNFIDRLVGPLSKGGTVGYADRLIKRGKTQRAFTVLARGARAGQLEARYRVGCAYAEGVGVPVNHANAAHWLTLAADAGHLGAKVKLAGLYLHGAVPELGDEATAVDDLFATRTKLQPDYVQAHYWAQLAAEEGQPDAQALLGTVLSLGPEEMRDQKAAEEWYRRAAEGGSPQGHLG
jgi:uncharacterized protein